MKKNKDLYLRRFVVISMVVFMLLMTVLPYIL